MNQPYNYGGPLPPPPPPPKPPKKRRTIPLWVFIVVVVGVMFASCGVGAASGGGSDETAVANSSGLSSADLDRREQSLQQRDERLQQRETELAEREETLDKRAAKLDEKQQKKAEQEAANSFPGDGTYIVGEDIKPGTYRSEPAPSAIIENCYWARLKNTSGDFGAIITNGNAEGPVTVTIKKSDGAFETSGCHDWKRR